MTGHQDDEILRPIAKTILTIAGGQSNLSCGIGLLLRECFDRVINTPKTRRRLIDDLQAPEKTYIGTCVENELRYFLQLPRGTVLDFEIDGVDVDLKFSIGDSWMIPPEAFGRPCIILSANESTAQFCFGLFLARPEYLTKGNRDKKCGISKVGRHSIVWLVKDQQYPPNFWQSVPQTVAETIVSGKGGNDRVIALFREIQDRPIARKVIEDVAMQKDPMRRSRADKTRGTRGRLAKDSIVLLCGDWKTAREFVTALGLPLLGKGEFMSHRVVGDEITLAKELDLI